MKAHLSDAEWMEILSTGRVEPRTHAERCEECRAEIARVEEQMRSLPDWAQVASARSDEFWSVQRARVQRAIQGMEASYVQRTPRLAWFAAAAMITIATVLLNGGLSPLPQEPHADGDHELLLEVERVVESGGPDALAPATLLLPEISQNEQSSPVNRDETREKNHEN